MRLNEGYIGDGQFLGISLGHYILGDNIAFSPNGAGDTDLFIHEFGHTYQSRITGPMYLLKYGIPSARGADRTEADADFRAHERFGVWAHRRPTDPWRNTWWEFLMGPFVLFR